MLLVGICARSERKLIIVGNKRRIYSPSFECLNLSVDIPEHSIARFSQLGYSTRFSLCHPNCHAAIKNHIQVTGKAKGCLSFTLRSDRLERTSKSPNLELLKKARGWGFFL